MSDKDIAEFVNVTQASPEVAREFLGQAGGELDLALAQFLSAREDGGQATAAALSAASSSGTTPLQMSRSGSGASSSSTLHRAPRHRFSTFSDLAREEFDGAVPRPLTAGGAGAGSGDDDPAQFFTGGEKSGLAVTNPNDGNAGGSSPGNLVDQIIRKAQQRAPEAEDDEQDEGSLRPTFQGRGMRLGSSHDPSVNQVAVESSSDEDDEDTDWGHGQPVLRRTLYFWRDGFSIDDGPLYRFDDPRNEVYLRAINMGRAPVELLKVKPHQAVDVRIEQRPTEEYVKPKSEPSLANAGPGQRLGSVPPAPAPSAQQTPAAPPQQQSPQQQPPQPQQPQAPAPGALGAHGDATVQIRLADGSVHRLRFESAGPVQQLYDFVETVGPHPRPFVLQLPMPPTKLEDRTASLQSAGAVGAVVVQRWI